LVIWYVKHKDEIGLVVEHKNSKQEVKQQLLIELEELGLSMLENIYVIDVQELKIIDFVICVDKEVEKVVARFVE